MVLRRRKQWSLRQTEQEVRDGAGYRDWVRVYDHRVPDHTTLNDLERLVQGKTQHQINDRLLALAASKHLTQGYKLRLDASVTETNIRYPTDSGLLLDGVRLLSRWLAGAAPFLSRKLLEGGVGRKRVRSARRRARLIGQLSHSTPKQDHHRQAKKKAITHLYGDLIEITHLSPDQATQAAEPLGKQKNNPTAEALISQLGQIRPLVERVIDQATRRVLQGESVPAQQKVTSLWEPHTQIIRRGKPQPHETEFGHQVNYAEVEQGLLSDWQICALGNPPDAERLPPFLKQHGKRFGHAPRVLAGDRGLFSPDNEHLAHRLGVAQIAIPHTGERTPERSAYEKQDWFKKEQCFRNGIEGRISVLKRTVQLKRCLAHASDGFERWVGMGILVANLVIIARLLHNRHHRKRKNVKVQT